MKNFKEIGWIDEMQHRLDQKFGRPYLFSLEENEITYNPRKEISKAPILIKEKP